MIEDGNDLMGRLAYIKRRMDVIGHYAPSAWDDAKVISEAIEEIRALRIDLNRARSMAEIDLDVLRRQIIIELYKGTG